MSDFPNSDYFEGSPPVDAAWSDDDWRSMLEFLIGTGLLTVKDVVALVLGHLNPPQVGTSIASSPSSSNVSARRFSSARS